MENLWGTQGAICLCENGGWGVSCGKLAVEQKRIVLVRLTLWWVVCYPLLEKFIPRQVLEYKRNNFKNF